MGREPGRERRCKHRIYNKKVLVIRLTLAAKEDLLRYGVESRLGVRRVGCSQYSSCTADRAELVIDKVVPSIAGTHQGSS